MSDQERHLWSALRSASEPGVSSEPALVEVSFACGRAFLHLADRGAVIAMEGDPNRQTGGRWSQEELIDLMLEINARAKGVSDGR